ncbi:MULTISPECIES: DUF4244 domain-containing protein [unclassified Kitasatospora]|uniref:DUF4244 domain-containing protein n=1 Tax=unclassified Kitasatospora TaxID=2633591 RepID=UPI0007C72657|nr:MULTISPECIES: DUF4244 domain-containing protein [unclassified Kitasatospora]
MTVHVVPVQHHRPAGPARRIRVLLRRRVDWLTVRARRLGGARADAGMTTAEYAVGTVAACAFAALLYKVVTSGVVSGALSELLNRALHAV